MITFSVLVTAQDVLNNQGVLNNPTLEDDAIESGSLPEGDLVLGTPGMGAGL